jgi:hypothetical protein
MSLIGYPAKTIDCVVWTTTNKKELFSINSFFAKPMLEEGTMTLTVLDDPINNKWIRLMYSPNNKLGYIAYTDKNKNKQPCILMFENTDQELLEEYATDIYMKCV